MNLMTDEDYDCAAIEVSLALAHMNWISMGADAAANIAALDTNTLNQYVLWESDSLPMKHAALAASYWVARRAMSILITEFMLSLPEATKLLTDYCNATDHALRTPLQGPDDERDYGDILCALIASIAERMPHGGVETSNFQPPQMMQ